ncbi:WecB/TagA/CpsF family glycosyltransferase [Roseovarius salis]|uniref:WecB/TagA/CpsF family glycosyltransferase n=1 Tax=Roseovarius salis TaxID=3376063 RepID=UPI0037CA4DBE
MQFSIADNQIEVNVPDLDTLSHELTARLVAGDGFALATLNLDHMVKIAADPAFAAAYAQHDMVVADGNPVVALSRLAGHPVALLPGADLILPLCRLAGRTGTNIALIGSDAATLEAAGTTLEQQVPGLRIVLRHAPRMGFDPDGQEADEIFHSLSCADAGLCFLALGAPKQERFAARGRREAPRVGFVSIGAGLDFIAGRQRRAPKWVRRLAMEWLWRALHDLPRLGPRYARCFAILPGQVWRAIRQRLSRR